MRHQKNNSSRSKPLVSQIIVKIQPGHKLLWQKNDKWYGWDLNIVDASTQGVGPAYAGVR